MFLQFQRLKKKSKKIIKSSIFRVNGPNTTFTYAASENFPQKDFPLTEILLLVHLSVTNPVKSAGILKLPPISVPSPIGEQKAETNPDQPPELPPQDLVRFHGFKQYPNMLLFVSIVLQAGGTFDLTNRINPKLRAINTN